MKTSKLTGVVAFGAACASLFAQSAPLPAAQREAVETVVREYLLKNPAIVRDALHALEAQAAAAEAERSRKAVAAHRKELLSDAGAVVLGNPKGDTTVVVFFDYRCSYCKKVATSIDAAIERDSQLRVVYKHFPILGPESVAAAKAVIAGSRSGKSVALHRQLVAGVEVKDNAVTAAESPSIDEAIRKNHQLGNELEISGTPALVIGDRVVRGAIDTAALISMIAAERSRHETGPASAVASGN